MPRRHMNKNGKIERMIEKMKEAEIVQNEYNEVAKIMFT